MPLRQYIAPFSFQRCLGHISCPIIFLNDPDVVPKRDFIKYLGRK